VENGLESVDDLPFAPQSAELKTLYVNRPLLNGEFFVDWAKSVGFATTLTSNDLHVTIAFSKTPVDWSKIPPMGGTVMSSPSGERSLAVLGEGAVVLKFECAALSYRFAQFIAAGCSWDWPEYQPHVTISFDAGDVDISTIEPYKGLLEFGPEEYAEVQEDWKDNVKEAFVKAWSDEAREAAAEAKLARNDYLYHATHKDNVSDIKSKGFKGKTYFARTAQAAVNRAAFYHDLDNEGRADLRVVRVAVKDLDPTILKPDAHVYDKGYKGKVHSFEYNDSIPSRSVQIVDKFAKTDTVDIGTNLVWYDQSSASSQPQGGDIHWENEEEADKHGYMKDKNGKWVRKPKPEKQAISKGANIVTDQISFFMPITKKEPQADGSVIVTGYASTPTKDLDEEIISLDAVKNALPAYMEWRNIREMHQPSAVGVAKEAHVDDVGLYLRAKIVEPGAIHLVNEGVYQGFSIGGRKIAKVGDTVTDLELVEISIVDRPCNPDTRFAISKGAKVINPKRIDLVKAMTAAPKEEHNSIELEYEEVGLLGRIIQKLSGIHPVKVKTAEHVRPAATNTPDPSAAPEEGEGMDVDKSGDPLKRGVNLVTEGKIKNKVDLANAVKTFDQEKNKLTAKRYIIRQAKLLKATDLLPEGWLKPSQDGEKLAKGRADFYTVSNLISLLGQLEWAEECCEGDGYCCGPYGNTGTIIDPGKDFTDKFGAILVQFGDMTAQLLDQILTAMKAEEAEEAATKGLLLQKAVTDLLQKAIVPKPTTLDVAELNGTSDDADVDGDVLERLAMIAKGVGAGPRSESTRDEFAELKGLISVAH
jgi:phage head maturation protease